MNDKLLTNTKSAAIAKFSLFRSQLLKGSENAVSHLSEKSAELKRSREPLSHANWYERSAKACESVSDAILNEKRGTSHRIVNAAAGQLGAVGVPAAVFSTAALLGTASTGTAIGSLSGAALTSATLAWVGGSVAMGGLILGVASVAGALGAVFGAGWVARKYLYGKKRDKSELDDRERQIVDSCLALAIAFRNEHKANRRVNPIAAAALYHDALKPLCDELLEYQVIAERMPTAARKKLLNAIRAIGHITSFALKLGRASPNLATGIVGAVITLLLADDIPDFNEHEQLVLDALRRSKKSLANSSDLELAEYVQSLDPNQLQGLSSNLMGITHELRYRDHENGDGDEYIVELFEETNHPGADAKVVNTITGEVREIQLKTSRYRSYVESHNERHADISLVVNEEMATQSGYESSAILREEVKGDVDSVVEGLGDVDDPSLLASMSVAAMITLARNVRVLLKGARITDEEKNSLIRGGVRSAVVSGLVHIVVG